MPFFPNLPTLSKKKQQQQQRPTISHPFPSTASPHPLPSPHPSTPSLRSAGSGYAPSTPSTLNHFSPAGTSPTTPPLRPSSPLALPERTHASNKQRRSGGGVRYRDWLILPGRNTSPLDGRDRSLPDERPDHADADADAAPPATADEVEVMVENEGKGFGVEGEVVAQVQEKVDLEVVDAFLEVALEDTKGRVLRARLAKRGCGLKPGQPDVVEYAEGDCFGGEGGVLRRDRRQADIIRASSAFRW